MNILGISGTPRKGGNSEILLEASLEPFYYKGWNVTKVFISENKINPCVGCDYCVKNGFCNIDDDMNKLYTAYKECDAIIISSPTYYRNVPSQLKAVFDRTYAIKDKSSLIGKLGGAIAVGRGSSGGQSIVLNIIYNFYLSCGLLCVPGELNGVHAVADEIGVIKNQTRRLEQAKILGENIIKYIEYYRVKK
jgi:multimeric flavodoxin WrbA